MARNWSIAAALLAAGCAAPMTAEDCDLVDWNGLGYEAGLAGDAPSRADRRFAQCAEAGRPGDRRAYMAGYDEGLDRYCTFDGVLQAALRGQGDILYCPDPSFAVEEAYDAGRSLHAAWAERDQADADRRDALQTFHRVLDEAERLSGKLPYIDDPQRRDELRREIDRLRSRSFREEQRGRDAEMRYARARDRVVEAERRVERLVRRADELREMDERARARRDAPGSDDEDYPPLMRGE